MKENFRKVWPIVLPILGLAAGVTGIIFFFVGPWGKGQYDVLAISVVLLAIAIITFVITFFGKKDEK